MAFEEVNTAGFKTYLTRYGISRLINPKAKFDIKYFSLNDDGINYEETVDSDVLVTSVNGDDIKTLYNGGDDIKVVDNKGVIPGSTVTPTDGVDKREIVFVDDCNGTEYKNLDVTIYLGNYLESLRNTLTNIDTVSRNYEPFIRLYDFINVYEYTENAFGEYKLWDTKNYNLNYVFQTDQDYKNYQIFTNTFVNKNGGKSTVIYDSNRFKSPFQLSFSSYKSESTNKITQNGKAVLQLYPVDAMVYATNIGNFKPEELTESIYNNARNITPTVQFNGVNHPLMINTNKSYKNNVNLPIFRFKNLLETGISSAKNMFEFYGNESSLGTNVKVMTINMGVMVSDSSSLAVKPKMARLKLNITLDLNESNWNSSGSFYKIN